VGGINIFYREAGDKSKQQIILLNGVPNASSAFQELMNDLKDDYYLVAPDFPGFGNSDIPDKKDYAYTFENISLTIEQFMEKMELKQPNVYALGYGARSLFASQLAGQAFSIITSYRTPMLIKKD
jgi:pimeloyl-ACP methyl ester carboxylesterase